MVFEAVRSWFGWFSPVAEGHARARDAGGPSLQDVIREVRRIEIHSRRLVDDVLGGAYESVFKGRGMEFSEVREYMVGDDIRTIDWNVTARMGHPFVKRYVEERELTVMLLVDASSSHDFGTTSRTKANVAVNISALLAFAAIQNNDRVGLILFTDEVELFVPPKKGRQHVLRLVRELLYFRPRHAGTDVARALEYLNQVIRKRCVAFLISDFISTDFERPLNLANQRHDMVAVSIVDPREREMPKVGFINLFDAETGEPIQIDTSSGAVRAAYRERAAEELARLEQAFRRLGVDHVQVATGAPGGDGEDGEAAYIQPLLRFFRQRAKRF